MRISDWSSDVCSSDLPKAASVSEIRSSPLRAPAAESVAGIVERGRGPVPPPAACGWVGMYIHDVYTEEAMTKEYRAKVFKSGNSVALRLPKALGLKDGQEMIVREERGNSEFEPEEAEARRLDLTGVYGSHPGLQTVELGRQN